MWLLKSFIASFPTATLLYVLLAIMADLKFDFGWFLFALIIDIVDDFVGKAL